MTAERNIEDRFKVLKYYSEERRWSAYDTDEMYIALIEIDGIANEYEDFKPFDPEEKARSIIRNRDEEEIRETREDELTNKYRNGDLNDLSEALELLKYIKGY